VTRRLFASLVLISLFAAVALAACAETPRPTATNVSFNPTPAGGAPTQPSESPTAGETPTPPPPPPVGDPARGGQLFSSNGCSGCHSVAANTLVGPGLAGVHARAETRTSLSADDYIRESIREPNAFVVEGFTSPSLMPASFGSLPGQDIEDLLAYLKTLE